MAAEAGTVEGPFAKSVADAVTVQEAERRARSSVTLTAPIGALIVVPGAPEPRAALTGTDIDSAPDVMENETVVLGSAAAPARPGWTMTRTTDAAAVGRIRIRTAASGVATRERACRLTQCRTIGRNFFTQAEAGHAPPQE
ncbi:hypothetical protein AB0D10_25945 [Kitasatospora sp. NPDC048545]|uniref:hypothetical protein n=1 Tax=Kitasatospora sp. NPDC048545 TaxID=3157208 RepID=UPI0033DB4C3C